MHSTEPMKEPATTLVKSPDPTIDGVDDTSSYTEAEEKAVLRKIDLLLMPAIWITYLFSYADRTNIGNAKVAGMTTDLHMSSGDYSMSLVIFFISYIIFEVPSNLILSKTRPSIYLCTVMVAWGIVTCCMAAIHSYHALLALRFVLGVLEASFAPGVSLMLSSWYKKDEQAKRFSIFYSAAVLSGAFGGIVSGAVTGNLDGAHGISGWRWLFIVEGVCTIGVAIIAGFILPDFPSTTKRFNARQRQIAVQRLAADNVTTFADDNPDLGYFAALKTSLTNWRTWILTLGYVCISGSNTMSYFYPTLVKGLGYTSTKAQYMTTPIYLVAFVATLCTGVLNDRIPNYRGLVIGGWLSVAVLCAAIICGVYNYTARYVLLVFVASGILSSNAASLAYSASTFGPMEQEARGVSLAFINSIAGLSGIYGAYFFPSDDAPKYLMGFGLISGLSALGVATYVTAHVLFRKYPLYGVAGHN